MPYVRAARSEKASIMRTESAWNTCATTIAYMGLENA